MSILPEDLEQDVFEDEELPEELPVPKDYAIDFDTGRLKLQGGKPYLVERLEAIRVWVWKALKTARRAGDIYNGEFGQDFENLIGSADYDTAAEDLKRYIEDCLLVTEYITGIDDFDVAKQGSGLKAAFVINTIYGDIEEEVELDI